MFDIRINDYQRKILVAALRHVNIESFAHEQYADNPLGSDTPVEELHLLQNMLRDLPDMPPNNLNDFTA